MQSLLHVAVDTLEEYVSRCEHWKLCINYTDVFLDKSCILVERMLSHFFTSYLVLENYLFWSNGCVHFSLA